MKTLVKITLVLIVIYSFHSCSKDDAPAPEPIAQPEPDATPELDPDVIPTVTEMSPLSGPKTTIVKFTGTDFGSNSSNVQAFIDNIAAEVRNVTNTEITIVVPPRAFFGEVKLIVDGNEFTDYTFDYEMSDIQVSTIAGGSSGNTDGTGANAQFDAPFGIVLNQSGVLYVSDAQNHNIRSITQDGTVTTIAGNGEYGFVNGMGLEAQFAGLRGMTTDSEGNLYVADQENHKIRKITPEGLVSTLAGSVQGSADGPVANATFNLPSDIMADSDDNLYITEENHKIRRISSDGIVTTFAGTNMGYTDGPSSNAQFSFPRGLVEDAQGNIYVADSGNHKIRKISTDGVVSTFAGSTQGFEDGLGSEAKFNGISAINIDVLGNLYVVDYENHSIRKIDANGLVSTIAGGESGFADGLGMEAQFDHPRHIVIDESFTIYLADTDNHRIRKITQE